MDQEAAQRGVAQSEVSLGRWSEHQVWAIFLQLCRGVEHLHRRHIVHRDVSGRHESALVDADPLSCLSFPLLVMHPKAPARAALAGLSHPPHPCDSADQNTKYSSRLYF